MAEKAEAARSVASGLLARAIGINVEADPFVKEVIEKLIDSAADRLAENTVERIPVERLFTEPLRIGEIVEANARTFAKAATNVIVVASLQMPEYSTPK
ncbi:hypothetical protein OKW30_006027 [Paraburkholderia sp. Clong3]|uniref:hypothetical protein n=1 Tax=Paraburkholderia sp. Clong3 TaxID=2991061 RepID=UPI003D20CE9F